MVYIKDEWFAFQRGSYQLKNFDQHPHFTAVQDICQRLLKNGYKAYLAGGCVRDFLLGRTAHDFDIATDARQEELEKLFPSALSVGKQFGVLIIPFSGFQVEISCFRADGLYLDGRRPSTVRRASPKEDAERRDFTVNALFCDFSTGQIIDFVGGHEDLQNKVLKTVGNPELRFEEDKLRLLRALRISAQIDFNIERQTFKSIYKLSSKVTLVSQERITSELRKMMLLNDRVRALHDLVLTGMAQVILPELRMMARSDSHSWARTGRHLAHKIGEESRCGLLWALLVWPEAKARGLDDIPVEQHKVWMQTEFESFFRRLRLPKNEILEALFVLSHSGLFVKGGSGGESDLAPSNKKSLSAGDVSCLINLNGPYGISLLDFSMVLSAIEGTGQERLLRLHSEFVSRDQGDGHLERPWIQGAELLSLGIDKGPKMGLILDRVYRLQISGLIRDKKEALDKARTMFSEMTS
jgi:tRNA nucleotidyltransferase/poly(A) polymerase